MVITVGTRQTLLKLLPQTPIMLCNIVPEFIGVIWVFVRCFIGVLAKNTQNNALSKGKVTPNYAVKHIGD